jgi:hypothetical protein
MPFFQHRMTPAEWDMQLDEALQRLSAAGSISRKPLTLTEAGRKEALAFLNLEALPPRANWKRIRDAFLIPRALGLTELTEERRKRLATADGLRAAILCKQYGLASGEVPTLSQALDALAWKRLNIDSTERFTRATVLARVFSLEGNTGLAKRLPTQVVHARNNGSQELRTATIRKWLDANSGTSGTKSGHVSFNLAGFAEAVREAARSSPTGRFGDHKVFISHIWRRLQEQCAFPGMNEAEFKRRLTEANHVGLLALSRADLVEAMDPEDVRTSETPYLNATYHFVQL